MIIVAITTAANAWLLQPAVDKIFVDKVLTMLWIVPAMIVFVAIIRGSATYGQSMLMHGVGQRIIADTQIKLYEHLIRADLNLINKIHTGSLLSNFLYDTQLLRDAVSRAITGIAKDGLTAIALTAVMFYQDWRLASAVIVIFPATGILARHIGKRMRKSSTESQRETGRLATHLSETFRAVGVIKAYSMERRETGRTAVRVEARLKQMMKLIRVRSVAVPFTEALGGLAVAGAILYGGWRAQAGDLSLGSFMSFLAALLMAYQPVKSLANLNAALQEGLAAAQRLFAILDSAPTIREAPDAVPLAVTLGNVEITGVTFSYENEKTLTDINIKIPSGKIVALVGPSGAGKSTLINLITRFHDFQLGSIKVDGQDIRDVTIESLRANIAIVSQETILFDDTILNNISYGNPLADETEIRAAAKAAAADGFIEALPEGYRTVVGENGVRLSGGQRQRIAIARAMIKDAPILLLDEATSSLDPVAEKKVQSALSSLMQGRTTFLIAHRLSTVLDADEICVLEEGSITQRGTHSELLTKEGSYASLYGSQFEQTN